MYSRYRLSSKHDKRKFCNVICSYWWDLRCILFILRLICFCFVFKKCIFIFATPNLFNLASSVFLFLLFFQKVYFYNFYNAFIILNDAFIYSFFFSVSLVIFFMYKFILEFNLTSSTIASSFIWSITFLNYLDIQQNQKYLYWNKNFIFNVIYLTISVCKE